MTSPETDRAPQDHSLSLSLSLPPLSPSLYLSPSLPLPLPPLSPFLSLSLPRPLQIEAGQYCTFVISCDGSVRACGKGSYGRLGLGDSNNQATLKKLTFEPHRAVKKVSSSKGSDGHTLAFTTEGEEFSWGDGDYGKLGHGNSSTQKYPKLIQGPLQGKVGSAGRRRADPGPASVNTLLPLISQAEGNA